MPAPSTERFDQAFLGLLAELPELACLLSVGEDDGLALAPDALTDWSPAGFARRLDRVTAAHAALAAGDDGPPLDHAVFRELLEHPTFEPLVGVAGAAFVDHPYLVCQEGGVQTELPLYFVNLHPLRGAADGERYAAKLERVPEVVRGLLASLRQRESRGLVPPRRLLEQALAEVRAFTAGAPRDHPLCATFRARLESAAVAGEHGVLDAPRLDALTSRVLDAVTGGVLPAYAELARFLVDQIPRAPEEIGVWRQPGGDDYYAYELRCQTSRDLSPDDVHRRGLERIARLRDEIDGAFATLGAPEGTLAERYARLAAGAGARWPDGEAGRARILERSRDLLDDVGARLGEGFGRLPRAPLVVRPVPSFCEAARTTTLHPASPDGSRPAIIELNLERERAAPTWELPTMIYHEGVPGHHLQLAIAQERSELPLFRRKVVFHAFVEGWAKYAEQLPWELGWNRDPIWRLALLRRELVSTANLALDTGIHHRRWTRDAAVRFCVESTGMDLAFADYLVDRIAARPGQTCSYAVGLAELRALRSRCERELGARFDLRAFHDDLLREGALPLGELQPQLASAGAAR
jgi:uncharacterized protein (DUF885 family)